MSDIVSAFKQNTRRKRANYQDEQEPKELNALSALQQKRQQNTVQQESNTNTALESSQRQNVQLGNNTSESQKLAQLQQLAAQEQAQNAANAAAAQQKQQEQQRQQTQQVQPKDNDGWKKYYDKEKQIVREQAFKSDGFGSWLQDVFNSGWDSRLAEQRARDKYANEMINQSFNDDGSVKDANKLNETKQFTAHNMNVAKQYGDYERARGNAIGANLTSDKHNNPFKATANAVRNMDIGNAILGSNDPEGTEGSKYNTARDVGKFLTNLVPGVLSAPITGLTNVSEAISGKGTDEQTGLEKELDNLSRVGKGIAGGIDVAGVFFGGSKEALTRVSDALFRKGAEKAVKETSKGVIKNVLDSMVKEGAEEATQQAAEFFGNGGKLVTKDGQFDNDSFKELLAESGKAGALGAVGGGLMNVGGRGVARLINNSQTRTNTQQGINSNINNNLIAREQAQENLRQKEQQAVEQPVTEDVRKTENVNEDVSEDTQEDTAERTKVQEEVKETRNTQYEQDIRNSLNDAYRNLSKTITPENKANLDGEMKQLADMRNTMPIDEYAQKAQEVLDKYSQTTAEQVVEPKTESATGQQVNPQDISKVTAPTVGTQASETPANVKTDVTENNAVYDNEDTDGLTKAYNRYAKRYEDALNSGDKEAISKARDNYNLALKTVAGEDTAQYDVDKGVVVNQVLAEEMYNNGIDGPAANTLHANMFDITDGKPLAHDYTTGEDLYFLDDINNALKRDGYKDAMGNQFKTFAQITKERDNANRQAFQQAIEESIAKSENVKPTAETELNDLIDTATNFEQHIARLEEDNRNRYKTDFGAGTLWRSDTPHKKGDVTFFTPEKWYAETYEDYIGAAGNAASRGNKLISNDKSLSNIYTIAPDGNAADLLSKGIRGEIERINTGEKSALTMVQREMYDELEKRGVKLRQSNDIVSRWINFLKNTVTYAGRENFNPVSLNKLFYDEKIPGGTPIPTLVKKALDNLGIDGLYLKNPMADKTHVGTPSEVIRFNWEKSTKPVAADNALATQSNAKTNTIEKAEPTADKINDIGYDRNISFDDFEQSRYDYYRSQDPDFKEYDDATINQWIERDWEILQSENDSQTNIDQAFDDRVVNEYGGEPTAETELNDLIDTARNEAPEPIPMEAYDVEPEMEQTPTQQPTTQNETVTTEPTEQINPFRQEIEQYYNTRKAELEDLYRATGLTPEIQSKVQNATDMSRTVDDPVDLGLTPEETNAYRKALELNPAVENVELAMARGYLPRQRVGTVSSTRLADEYINTGKINKLWENSRLDESEGGISAEEADTSYDPLIDWHIRAENPELNNLEQQAAAYDLVDDIAPNADQDTKVEASQDISNMIDELNDVASGEEIKDSDIKKVKPLDTLEKVGTKTQQQKVLIPKMRGLSDDVKLKNETNPQYDQWYHNASFGYMQNLNAFANDTKENVDSLITNSFEHLTDKQRQGILAKREKIYNGILKKVQDEKLATFMTNRTLIKEAFNKNIMNYGTKVEFENPKDKAMMNEYFARYMLQDRYEQSFLQKTGVVVQRIMNSSFRGMRVQTTLNEIPEILSSMSDFRTLKVAKLGTWQQTKARYGIEGNSYTEQFINSLPKDMRVDIEQAIDGTEDVRQQVKLLKQIGKKFGNALDKADKATQWNAFVQDWKDATYLQNAENFYREQGFEGPALTEKVLSSFEARMLPMSRVFKIIKTDSGISKPFLMYMDSTARLTRKFAKGVVGENKVGVNADLNRGQRIVRNIGTDVLPRSITAMIMGVPITSVIGAFQMGGDYSGISDEDKNVLDEAINFIAQLSPVVSVLAYGYNQERQDEIAEGQGNNQPDLRGDAGTRFVNNLKKTFTPLGARLDQDFGYAGNLNNTKDVYGRGYGENKSGRVQYLSPDNPVDWVLGAISGANRTSEAREYANNPDLISAIINQIRNKDYDGDEQADGGFSDFLKYNQAFTNPITGKKIFASEDDYNRPASMSEQSNYNQKIQDALKDGDRELAQEWYEKSRQYNSVLDNLRVNNKDAYDVYQSQYDKNIVTPEKWARIAYGNATADRNPQSIDLTVWNTMKQLALQRGEDFDTPVDPAYTQLDDEQARRYLAYRATATGEDVLLKKDMCLDPFWDSFFDEQNDYYNKIGNRDFDDSAYSARVQEWNDWNDQYGDYQKFISGNIDTMKDQQLAFELSLQFPLMTEYQKLKTALKAKYGDEYKDSQEYKTFWSQNYDAYQEESDAFNQRMLYIINQMRRIEGFDDMTIDQLEAINGFGKDSSKKSSGKSSGKSYGGSDYSYAPKFENIFQADPLYAKEYGGFRPVKPNLSGNPNFENVGFSSTAGKDPYAQV